MSEDDKPFLCGQPGCGMRFTNEDHLCVHMRKHDMSLALNLCETPEGLSLLGFLTDQTPTPTKFLRNCEEIGLFQELSKNPFDDSFKNAMGSSVDNTLQLHLSDSQDLDTPQPPIPQIIVGDQEIMESDKASDKPDDKTKDTTVSSILPKKRKKFITQKLPTGTTSDEDEEPLVVTSDSLSLEQNALLLQDKKLKPETVCEIDNSVDIESVAKDESVQNVEPKYTAKAIVKSKNKPIGGVVSFEGSNFVPVMSSGIEVNAGSKPSQSPSPLVMPVLLKLPSGQMIQIQIPVSTSGTNPNPPTTKTNNLQNVTFLNQNLPQVLFTGNQLVYQNVQQVPSPTLRFINQPFTVASPPVQGTSPSAQTGIRTVLNPSALGQHTALRTVLMPNKQPTILQTVLVSPSSTPQMAMNQVTVPASQTAGTYSETPSSGSQSYTKQRLKAAIQQQSASAQNQKVNQLFKMMTNMKDEPLWSPGPLEGMSVVSPSSSTDSPDGYLNQQEQLTLQQMMPDSADDVEVRRMKFLERNRAAAARCRQKRKHFIQTLEEKATNLCTVNSKLCGEIKKLKGEVAHLKTLLLTHKECPVTMQQRSQGQITTETLTLDDSEVDFDKDNGIQTVPEITVEENHQPAVVTVNHSNFQNVTFPLGLLQGVKIDNLPSEMTSLGVITGPNSISLLPKLFNFDRIVPTTSSS